jgi:excisionase family DNA binding protein
MDEKQQSEPTSIRELLAAYHHAITAKDLAEILQVQPDSIYKNARAGNIPHFRIGTSVRFDPKAITQWLEQQQIGGLNTLRAGPRRRFMR